jgi:hypothetical protein
MTGMWEIRRSEVVRVSIIDVVDDEMAHLRKLTLVGQYNDG